MVGDAANGFLVFQDVTKRYRDVLALDRATFSVKEGSVFGFIGPNGAGKTTSIKIMVGLLLDFQGTVLIGGRPMPAAKAEVHRMLGYMPQHVAFQEWRTVDHVLSTYGRLSGMSRTELEPRIQEVLSLLGIQEFRQKKVVELSGGTVQKVGMAQALLHGPSLMVLDEPMAGLDPASRYQLKNIIKDLGRQGTTVFFSSHILSDVQDVATQIGMINHGRLMWTGTMEELKAYFKVTNDWDIVLSHDTGGWRELEALDGVTGIDEVSPGRLLAHVDATVDVDETVHRLLKGLLDSGCHVRSFTPVSPDLEELYMRWVGGGDVS